MNKKRIENLRRLPKKVKGGCWAVENGRRCYNKHQGRGYCPAHYALLRSGGWPEVPEVPELPTLREMKALKKANDRLSQSVRDWKRQQSELAAPVEGLQLSLMNESADKSDRDLLLAVVSGMNWPEAQAAARRLLGDRLQQVQAGAAARLGDLLWENCED